MEKTGLHFANSWKRSASSSLDVSWAVAMVAHSPSATTAKLVAGITCFVNHDFHYCQLYMTFSRGPERR